MAMDVGETRVLEAGGQEIWLRKIHAGFYVMNGIYCAASDSYDLEDPDRMLEMLATAKNPFFPYSGADAGAVLAAIEIPGNPGHYCGGEYRLSMFEDIREADCKEALDEYRAWAGLRS